MELGPEPGGLPQREEASEQEPIAVVLPEQLMVRVDLIIHVRDPQLARIIWGGFKYYAAAEFIAKSPDIAAAYDLDFEVLEVRPGSYRYVVAIKLKLKKAISDIRDELRKAGKLALLGLAFHAPHDINEFGKAIAEWIGAAREALQKQHPGVKQELLIEREAGTVTVYFERGTGDNNEP